MPTSHLSHWWLRTVFRHHHRLSTELHIFSWIRQNIDDMDSRYAYQKGILWRGEQERVEELNQQRTFKHRLRSETNGTVYKRFLGWRKGLASDIRRSRLEKSGYKQPQGQIRQGCCAEQTLHLIIEYILQNQPHSRDDLALAFRLGFTDHELRPRVLGRIMGR